VTVARSTCSFCGAAFPRFGDLVRGFDAAICAHCVQRARIAVPALEPDTSSAACSFCGHEAREAEPRLVSESGAICADCLATCARMLEGGRA
jgi:hypothetical protein